MSDERTPLGTHCEFCGLEYAAVEERRAPKVPGPKPPRGDELASDPIARCEFCGAEYPAPEEEES